MLIVRTSCLILLGVVAFGQYGCSHLFRSNCNQTGLAWYQSEPPDPRNAKIEFEPSTGQATISIRVVAACSNEPLIGCPVRLASTTQGALTNVDGNADITGMAPGVYVIELQLVGYHPMKLRNVVVLAGYTSDLGTVSMFETPPPKLEYYW